jgi:hypothetical protein
VKTSAVKCENIYVKLQRDMRKIGVMPPSLLRQVNDALKVSLDLS